jgi:hypothetical protein
LGKPVVVDQLLSRKADGTAVNVTPIKGQHGRDAVEVTASAARGLAERIRQQHPEASVHLTRL